MKTLALSWVALALLLLVFIGLLPVSAQARVTLAAACPPARPGFFACELMGGLGRLIPQNLSNVEAVVLRTAAFPDAMQSIAERRADLGIVGSVIVLDAFLGEDVYRGKPIPVRTLTPIHDLFVYHLVTLEETGIRVIGDLRGKRVALDPPVARDALRFLRAAGLDPDRDMRRETPPLGGWTAALRERRVDAAFVVASGSFTEPGIIDLAITPGVRMRLIPLDGLLATLQKEFGARYVKGSVGKELYPGMTADVPTIVATALVIATQAFDTDLAYQITRLIYERRGELAQSHSSAQYITLLGAAERSRIPFHPGAVRYFKERGVLGF